MTTENRCVSGDKCRNPSEDPAKRPTVLRNVSYRYCVYCRAAMGGDRDDTGWRDGSAEVPSALPRVAISPKPDAAEIKFSLSTAQRAKIASAAQLFMKTLNIVSGHEEIAARFMADVTRFVNNKDISEEIRSDMVKHLESTDASQISLILVTNAYNGNRRDEILKSKLLNQDSSQKRAPDDNSLEYAAHYCDWKHDISVPTMRARFCPDSPRLEIIINPMYASVLSDASVRDAFSHEFLHHAHGHPMWGRDILEEYIRSVSIFGYVVPQDLRRRLQYLVNDAFDMLVNDELGIDRLNIDCKRGSPGYDFQLITLGLSCDGACIRTDEQGELYFPMHTLKNTPFVNDPRPIHPLTVFRYLAEKIVQFSPVQF